MKKYKLVCKKGEGTFSEVVKAENLETGTDYAIKCMKNTFKSLDQVNALREIQALRKLSPHPNIITLEEVLYDQPSGRLAMVFELMDANLYDLISGRRDHLNNELVRRLSHQMFIALQHMHDNGIFHRDIKPENILVDTDGDRLKLADLGSCRSIQSKQPLTEYIATRWYRSPECLLTDGHYGPEMDIFGAGCVLFELIALFPLFPGADEVDQVNRIHKVLGTPPRNVLMKLKAKGSRRMNYNFPSMKGIGIKHFIPHASLDCINLIEKTLIYDYEKRIDARGTIDHEYFSAFEKPQSLMEKKKQFTRPSATDAAVDSKKKLLKKTARVADNNTKTRGGGDPPEEIEEVRNIENEERGLSEDESNTSTKSKGLGKHVYTTKSKVTKSKVSSSKVDTLKNIQTNLQNNRTTRKAMKNKSSNRNDNNSTGSRNAVQNNRRLFGRDTNKAKSSTKVSDVTSDIGRRRNPRLPKFDKRSDSLKKSSKSKDSTTEKAKRKNKYANVVSSGYGTTYKTVKPLDRSKLRQKGMKVSQTSAGTGKTTSTSLSSSHSPKASRIQKNKASLSRVNEKKIMSKRKQAQSTTRLPIISNA